MFSLFKIFLNTKKNTSFLGNHLQNMNAHFFHNKVLFCFFFNFLLSVFSFLNESSITDHSFLDCNCGSTELMWTRRQRCPSFINEKSHCRQCLYLWAIKRFNANKCLYNYSELYISFYWLR